MLGKQPLKAQPVQRPCGGSDELTGLSVWAAGGRGRQVKGDEASQEGGFRPRVLQDFGSYAKKK